MSAESVYPKTERFLQDEDLGCQVMIVVVVELVRDHTVLFRVLCKLKVVFAWKNRSAGERGNWGGQTYQIGVYANRVWRRRCSLDEAISSVVDTVHCCLCDTRQLIGTHPPLGSNLAYMRRRDLSGGTRAEVGDVSN